jgi:acetyltransferase-like isoleucine patch superfamily enzyme
MSLSVRELAKVGLQAVRIWRLRLLGASIDPSARVERGVLVHRGWSNGGSGRISIAKGCRLETGVVLDAFGGHISLGTDVFLGPHVVVYGHGGVEIGDSCLIAMHCRILSSNHTVPPYGTDIRSQPDILLPTRIGRDVWLGAGVTVLGGVFIGEGCVIGAGSVVTKTMPAGAIAMGTPAEIKGFRENHPPAG